MKRLKALSAFLLPLALLCSGPVSSDPPAATGVVTREEVEVAHFWVDFDTELLIVVGADIVEFCDGIIDWDVVYGQYVQPPTDDEWLMEMRKGEVRAQVFDFVDFDCDLFLTNEPLASGMVQLITTDNDVWQSGKPNANAWGYMASGFVYTSDDVELALSAVVRYVYLKKQDRYREHASIVLD